MAAPKVLSEHDREVVARMVGINACLAGADYGVVLNAVTSILINVIAEALEQADLTSDAEMRRFVVEGSHKAMGDIDKVLHADNPAAMLGFVTESTSGETPH